MFKYQKVTILSFIFLIDLVKSQDMKTPEEIQEKIKLWKTTE